MLQFYSRLFYVLFFFCSIFCNDVFGQSDFRMPALVGQSYSYRFPIPKATQTFLRINPDSRADVSYIFPNSNSNGFLDKTFRFQLSFEISEREKESEK